MFSDIQEGMIFPKLYRFSGGARGVWGGGAALQYEMDIGVRLLNPGAFGESEGKKSGHWVRAGQNEPKFPRSFGANSSRFEGKIGFCCEKFQKLGIIWRQNVNFFSEKMPGLWVTEKILLKNMGSLGDCKKYGVFG